jgi:hypothetical protein
MAATGIQPPASRTRRKRRAIEWSLVGMMIPGAAVIVPDRLRSRRAGRFYRAVMFLPYFLSWIVVSSLVLSLLSVDLGFVTKHLIPALGLRPANRCANPGCWPFILVFGNHFIDFLHASEDPKKRDKIVAEARKQYDAWPAGKKWKK